MEKLKKQFKINYDFDWTYGISIAELRKDLDSLEKIGATHVDMQIYESYDDPYIRIEAKCERLETDKEFEERVKEVKKREEITKARELAELEKLKLKYEK